jgi:hypothetical protein
LGDVDWELMRVLGPIVETFVLPMLDAAQDVLFGCSVTRQFIGNDDPSHAFTDCDGLHIHPRSRYAVLPPKTGVKDGANCNNSRVAYVL